MAYFERTGPDTFHPTPHVGGAWKTDEQHVAPALGLLAHVVEQDRDHRRDDRLLPSRLTYDIWGTLPMEEVTAAVRVVRPGRTIELVEATLSHGGRTAVTLRAWLTGGRDTSEIAGSNLDAVPGPGEVPAWDPTTVWPGGFIASADVRREQSGPGRAVVWARVPEPLVAGEDVSGLSRTAGMLDIVNGMTVLADPTRVAFPNLDLTAHLVREPVGEWVGFDARVSFGPTGLGLTNSVLHDEHGPIGTTAQTLTLRT